MSNDDDDDYIIAEQVMKILNDKLGWFFCDECKHRGKGEIAIVGDRYRCNECADYDLCSECMRLLKNNPPVPGSAAVVASHPFCGHGFTHHTCSADT